MKILFFIETFGAGGRERRLLSLLKGLSNDKNFECHLLLLSPVIEYEEVYNLNVKIYFNSQKSKFHLTPMITSYKIIKKINPDIIHSWGHFPSVYSILPAKYLKIPFINAMITTASPDWKIFSKKWIFTKITFPFSDIIVANSIAGLISHHVNTKKGIYIYNGFDFDRLQNISPKKEIKQKFNIQTKYVVGMVANVTDKKDYVTFVKSALKVLSMRDDVTFISVGNYLTEGKPNKYYLRCINIIPPKFKDYIKFLGRQEEVVSIINIFDIALLSTYSEGISNSIMEYMALKKPVIVSKGGGTRELIINNITGFIVEQKSPEEFSRYILKLLSDDNLRYELGKKGYERLYKKFNLSIMIEKHKQLYDKLFRRKQ